MPHQPAPTACDTRSSGRPPRLSPAEVAFYQREGYLLPPAPVFAQAEFSALTRVIEGLIGTVTANGERPEQMNYLHFYHPELMRWLLHPALLDLIEPITGPDILLYSTHLVCKPPGDGARVPWHDDSNYWQGQWDPMEVVGLWLAIDDSDLDNGCMHVVPRTHLSDRKPYGALPARPPGERTLFGEEIRAGAFDEALAVPCVLRAGQASLHHNKLIHGSIANTSSRRRCGYAIRYISAAARFDPDQVAARVDPERNSRVYQIYQARGRNLAGNQLADPHRVNQPWIDRFGPFRSR
jgi:ectoine hydroxylase-related dioxygenase (phytanoyl-CoA dioxygenase family)